MVHLRPCLRLWLLVAIFCLTAGGSVIVLAQHGKSDSVGGVGNTRDRDSSPFNGHLIDLHEDNWQLMLKGEWMVEFFAPWCPACKNLAPTWERFASSAGNINVNVAKIDVTTSPSLSGRFFVTALPTIYHVKDGEFRQYRGSRDGDALLFFLKQEQWKKIDPISSWKKPDTIHMSVLSYFFKLSHTLKDLNSRLQEEYGLPTWGSYALFAIGTIFVGAALGLILVCIVDFLYPPKKSQRQSFSEVKENSKDFIEDLANDEIEDDEQSQNDDEDEENEDEDNEDEEDVEESNDDTDDDENKVDTVEENDVDENEKVKKETVKKNKKSAARNDAGDNNSDGEKNSNSDIEQPECEKNTTHSGSTSGIKQNKITNKSDGGDSGLQKSDEITTVTAEATTTKQTTSSSSPSEVRKRKPRKAD